MRTILAVLVAAGLASCSPKPDAATTPHVEPAPLEYTHPVSLAGISFLPTEEIDTYCRSRGAKVKDGYTIRACAGSGVMTMPNPCEYPDDPYAVLLCHEMAHLNGWRH